MKRPTCSDCAHAERCSFILGPSFSATSARCDWTPSRFLATARADKRLVHIDRGDSCYHITGCRQSTLRDDIQLAKKRRPPTCPACLEYARVRALKGVVDVRWPERVREFFEASSRS